MVHEIIPVMIGEEETNARLYTYFWSNSKELYDGRRRPCVLICPGGGYEHLSPREGEPIAMKYLAMGKWWLALFPGLLLVFVVVLFHFIGDTLSRLLDPAQAHL